MLHMCVKHQLNPTDRDDVLVPAESVPPESTKVRYLDVTLTLVYFRPKVPTLPGR